jgi:hypothetical protein
MNRDRLYREMNDVLAYASAYAPDFPAEDETDLAWVFMRLAKYVEQLDPLEANKDSKRWLALANQELAEAFRLYNAGNESEGRRHMTHAEDYLKNAEERKAIRADFIGGDESFGVRGPFSRR